LAKRFQVIPYAWDDPRCIEPAPGDLLLGHPHPSPWTVFQRSALVPGWSKVVLLCPYNGEGRQVAWLDPFVEKSDRYLAITGPYWAQRLPGSAQARWAKKFQAVDLAIDQKEYPRVKKGFAPMGRRRFVYIGHAGWPKNTEFLSALAQARPQWEFAWAGGSDPEAIPGVKPLGRLDFAGAEARALMAGYDFMITVGTADANPSTILEAMAWGLVPVCSPQSGYEGLEGIPNLPIESLEGSLAALDALQSVPESTLRAWVRKNDGRLRRHYAWSRFCTEVERALLAPPTAPLQPHSFASMTAMRWQAWRGPNAPWRPRWALKALRDRWRAA